MNFDYLIGCESKAKHLSKNAALVAMKKCVPKEELPTFDVYQCKCCNFWHIGHKKGTRTKEQP
jgi:hypothetical protein